MARNVIKPHVRDQIARSQKPSKDNSQEYQGVVSESLPCGVFRVQLNENNHIVRAHTSGKMKQHNIRILVGDLVTVSVNEYDITQGRITFRHREIPSGGTAHARPKTGFKRKH